MIKPDKFKCQGDNSGRLSFLGEVIKFHETTPAGTKFVNKIGELFYLDDNLIPLNGIPLVNENGDRLAQITNMSWMSDATSYRNSGLLGKLVYLSSGRNKTYPEMLYAFNNVPFEPSDVRFITSTSIIDDFKVINHVVNEPDLGELV